MAWRRERPAEGGARGAGPAAPLLVVQGLDVHYGRAHALQDVSLTLERGVLGIVGRNGMGKTTLCNAITGLVPARGSVRLAGQELVGLAPHRITRLGIAYVPQGRRVWPSLTVDETLRLVARHRREVDRVYAMFPRLAERKGNGGSQLSGGEQQMLAIGRGMMAEPRLLILDEPSLGLSPLLVEQMFTLIGRLHEEGLAVLLVEQNVGQSLEIADRAYVLENGAVRFEGRPDELLASDELRRAYLGL
jgi:ABC-type branched-subunit amino acid transport system ATPase component